MSLCGVLRMYSSRTSLSAQLEADTAALVLAISAAHVIFVQPYERNFHNYLAAISICACTLCLWGGTASSSTFKDFTVLGGLSINLLAIIVGVVYDMVRGGLVR